MHGGFQESVAQHIMNEMADVCMPRVAQRSHCTGLLGLLSAAPWKGGWSAVTPPSIPVADMAGEEQETSAGPVWPWADCRKLGEWELRAARHRPLRSHIYFKDLPLIEPGPPHR